MWKFTCDDNESYWTEVYCLIGEERKRVVRFFALLRVRIDGLTKRLMERFGGDRDLSQSTYERTQLYGLECLKD